MAIPTVTTQQISEGIVQALEKLAPEPLAFGPPPPDQPIPMLNLRQTYKKIVVPLKEPYGPPVAPVVTETQPMVVKEDILLTPPISKDVIIMPPSMAAKPSLLLPILVTAAILLIQ